MTFKKLDTTPVKDFTGLNDNQKKRLVDLYAEGSGASGMKHDKTLAELGDGSYIPSNICKSYINKIKTIENDCATLMRGQYILTPEESHIDEETGEKVIDQEVVYNTSPETIAELKTQGFDIHTDCTKVAFEYLIDVMIENKTTEGDFATYKLYFDNQE